VHSSRLSLLCAGVLLAMAGCFVDALGGGRDGGTGGAGGAATSSASGDASSSASDGTTAASSGATSTASSGMGGAGGAAPEPCPVGWTLGALQDCYRVVPPGSQDGVDRDEAKSLCEAAAQAVGESGRLASPNNTPDIATLETLGGAQFDIWTSGRYDSGQPNQFVWEGSPDTFNFQGGQAPWAGNQPDNMPGESCVIITDGALHTYECWDVDFSQPFAAGCEIAR